MTDTIDRVAGQPVEPLPAGSAIDEQTVADTRAKNKASSEAWRW